MKHNEDRKVAQPFIAKKPRGTSLVLKKEKTLVSNFIFSAEIKEEHLYFFLKIYNLKF